MQRKSPPEEAYLRIKLHRLPALASFCLGLVLGIALLTITTFPNFNKNQSQHLQTYGSALASMAANQAIEASFNNDLVGLQAILQETIKNPGTLLATIHDVENRLLVQGGDSRALETTDSISATAAIVLHSNITGYLTVHLEKPPAGYPVPVFLILGVCAVLLGIAAWQLHTQQCIERIPSLPPATLPEEPDAEDIEQELPSTPEVPLVYAIVHVKNLAVLQQQLNGENYRKTLSAVDCIISDVLALYNGAGYGFNNDQFELRFYANDATNEALFRAACSAWLIVELASIVNTIPLDLAAFVSANHLDLAPANLPIAGLVLESQAAADLLISRRLNFLDVGSDDGRKVVAGFEQPFKTLLEKQRAQLSALE